jgi:hypothetical protein
MKDIKVKNKKVVKILEKEKMNSISKKSFSIYKMSFDKEKVFAISCFSLCIFSITTYIISVTSITFFAVQERNFSYKYEKLFIENANLKNSEEINFLSFENNISNLDTKKIIHLTFIDTNISDQVLTQK